jgi:mannose-1-phosphate guanylyltransferase
MMTDLDLQAMLVYHRERNSKLTIALTPVEDPTAFGLVETEEDGRIRHQPSRDEVTTNMINAGTYILEPEVFRYVPPAQHYMFERGLFPVMLQTRTRYMATLARTDRCRQAAGILEVHHDILIGKVRYAFRGQQIADRWPNDAISTSHRSGGGAGAGVRITPAHDHGPAVIGARCGLAQLMIQGAVIWDDNLIAMAPRCVRPWS